MLHHGSRQILERLLSRNKGPFPSDTLKAVYREILSSSLSLERPLRVAYLGPRATFTHMAGMQQFGLVAQYLPVETIKDVFSEVERGRTDFGVVPVENSTEGVVNYTLDMFIDSDLKIYAEIMLEVSQNLMNKSGKIEDITRIYTHPQVPGQCREWMEKNMSGVPVLNAPSTAKAAEMAADDPTAGAIASEMAAVLYGLQIVGKKYPGQHEQLYPLPRYCRQIPPEDRPGQDLDHVLHQGQGRSALYHACAICRGGNQPDKIGCPAFGQEGLGLCVLLGHGRPY